MPVVYEDYSGRIKEIRAHFKMNKAEFAVLTKTYASTLSEYESRNREPSKEFIKTLSEIGININWFLTGKGPMLLEAMKKAFYLSGNDAKSHEKGLSFQTPPGIPLVYEDGKEFENGIVIPVLGDNPVSAGSGAGVGEDELPTRYIPAPRELSKYPHLMGLPVKGDSMEPTLHEGDLAIADGGGWDGDGIYVIKTVDETFVKRVLLTPQGYRITSDNKVYESYNGNSEEIAIVGKVRAMVVMVPGKRGGV
jgi:phage repressor protein C with HTH and peptisase S24 domain